MCMHLSTDVLYSANDNARTDNSRNSNVSKHACALTLTILRRKFETSAVECIKEAITTIS